MRLTDSIITKNYLKNLNSNLKDLTDKNIRVAAQRRYMTMSEDPATALKAMKVRKNLYKNSIYAENLTNAQGILDQYESAIANINEIVTEAKAQVAQGRTGTSDELVRKSVANALRGYQTAILAAANTKYANDYIFGGESVGKPPFTVDENGNLLYHGKNVDTETFEEESRYIDIGLGLSIGEDGVNSQSALNIANSGAVLLGTGKDKNGVTNNLYNLLGILAQKIENNDLEDIQIYADKLEEKSDDIRLQYVSVGEKTNYIKFFTERLKAEESNLKTKQSEFESIHIEEGIIEYSEMEVFYNACLKMGTKLLQPSLLDFLR